MKNYIRLIKRLILYFYNGDKMFVDYEPLKKKLIGSSVPKPLSGTLSGHAAGEPFDKHAYSMIKKQYPQETFRQYEYLNSLFTKNHGAKCAEARNSLFKSPTVLFLLSRGKNATDKWSLENPFEEKQNDTADIIVAKDNKFEIIDVKTKCIKKDGQPPNIISAYKLAQVCAKIIDNKDYDVFTINYLGIDWDLEADLLVCKKVSQVNLFKSNPESLYINWAAAMQIQFHVENLDQSFKGTMEEWARKYIKHFITQAKRRSEDMIRKFVKPFEKYVID